MDKFKLILDWIEYGAKCLMAIAKGLRAIGSDWPTRPTRSPVAPVVKIEKPEVNNLVSTP